MQAYNQSTVVPLWAIADREIMRFQGHMFAERTRKSGQLESAVVVPGSLLGCAAYLSSTKTRAIIRTAEPCKLVAFGPHELEKLLVTHQPPAHVAHCCACVVFPYVDPNHHHGSSFKLMMILRPVSQHPTVYVVMLHCFCLLVLDADFETGFTSIYHVCCHVAMSLPSHFVR